MGAKTAVKPDFGGYVTRYGVKCSDGRTILKHAFSEADGEQVPLVWQHQHNSPDNVLGHLVLEHKDDGVYGHGYFNDTPAGQKVKKLVANKDVKALSIFATQVAQKSKAVVHGVIREASIVLGGANRGAFIDNVNIAHGDDLIEVDDEIVISPGEGFFQHEFTRVDGPRQISVGNPDDIPDPSASSPADGSEDGDYDIEQVLDSMTPVQREAALALAGAAVEHGALNSNEILEGTSVPQSRNIWNNGGDGGGDTATLSHSDLEEIAHGIFAQAQKGGSFKDAVYAWIEDEGVAHGIDSIDQLFPFDQAVTDTPDFISRRMDWVQGVLGGAHKTPFSRIRSWTADLTFDEARARGYVKGSLKKDQYFEIARRVTTPCTVYKRQKLDRDDIVDITEFSVVNWMLTELRVMLDEELARAILFGDGRAVDDPDKISESNIRPIMTDADLYLTHLYVDLTDANSTADEIVDGVVSAMQFYRGSGGPTFYTTRGYLSQMLLVKDTDGRRIYGSIEDLTAALNVSRIVPVEVMDQQTGLIGVIVNMADYTIGMDKGGEVNNFDFFDIDYNQYKYLIETRCSGALTKYKSAIVVHEFTGAGGMLANPTAPTFVKTTGVVTIPTFTHATYVIVDDSDGTEGSALSSGAQTAIAAGAKVHIRAKAASTYSFQDTAHTNWTFQRNHS